MRKVLLAAVLALTLPAQAEAGRFALGVEPGFSAKQVAVRVEAATGRSATVIGPFAVAVTAPSARGLASVRGVSYVERVRPRRQLTFVPNDPLVGRQWYLDRTRAFDAWSKPPPLENVKVAVIDSGVDAEHPDLEDSIAEGRSFVPSSWRKDTNGHGTFVAGQIAAELNNAQGIAGIAFASQLLIAKVLRGDDTISPEAEAHAIRWAVDRGARVINISFGGTRDPFDSTLDTYSRLEAAAVEYAVQKGALVVAAVGNGDKAPREPWEHASYPAALPHVLGVSAVRKDGSVPDFSNRDPLFNDIAAPGEDIFSTVPRGLTANRATCFLQGYSDCGPSEFRRGEGTSFAAPQVAAAAALLLSVRPWLQADQIMRALESGAVDATPARGCRRCSVGRDELTGWGVLDVTEAIESVLETVPPADRYEPNDGAGVRAYKLYGRRGRSFAATLHYWNDPLDVYQVLLRRGQRLRVRLSGPRSADAELTLWTPTTQRVGGSKARRLAARDDEGRVKRIRYRARTTGWYYVQVRLSAEAFGRYRLRLTKDRLTPAARRGARAQEPGGSSEPGSRQRQLSALRP